MSYNQRSSVHDNFSAENDDSSHSSLSIIEDAFDFDDSDEKWLCSISRRNSIELSKVDDLNAWLRADSVDSDKMVESDRRKSIDSRTFTRAKRKSVDKDPCKLNRQRGDSVPMMLRPKNNTQLYSTLMSERPTSITSQTSMEAFKSLAHCNSPKENLHNLQNSYILSDINCESEVNNLLMNISQPSLLYSSLISETNNASSLVAPSLIDSQILTDSMMDASMFKDVQDSTMISEFLRQNDTVVDLENDKTFHKSSDNSSDRTVICKPDETFVSAEMNFENNKKQNFCEESNGRNIKQILDKIEDTPSFLDNTNIISSSNVISNLSALGSTKNDISPGRRISNSTFQYVESQKNPDSSLVETTFTTEKENLASTFKVGSTLRDELIEEIKRTSGKKLDCTYNANPQNNLEINFNATYIQNLTKNSSFNKNLQDNDCDNGEPKTFILEREGDFATDSTFTKGCKKMEGIIKATNATFINEAPFMLKNNENKPLDETYVQPFEAEVQNVNLDVKFNNYQEDQPQLDRFKTFRKDTNKNIQTKASENATNNMLLKCPSKLEIQRAGNKISQLRYSSMGTKTVTRNIDDNPKNDFPFAKPVISNLPKKPQIGRLSKLPQLFQKSNPNLGTILKPTEISLDSNKCYNKGSHPNISSKNIISGYKNNTADKCQSPKKNIENLLSTGTTSSSLESIGSSASVHSAPDLDDRPISNTLLQSRLAFVKKIEDNCADLDSRRNLHTANNHHTFIKKGKDREIANIGSRYDCLFSEQKLIGRSTPKVRSKSILENTWIEGKLPSPILKNGVDKFYEENCESRSLSPTDVMEFTAKTSSPLNNSPPMPENENINSVDLKKQEKQCIVKEENKNGAKQIKASSAVTAASMTKLRRPTNFTAPNNKGSNGVVSGIPRPASRIPAPKFSRPSLK